MRTTFASKLLFVFFVAAISAKNVRAVGGQSAAAPTRPNILFILCDDLGINDLHCYGRQDHHTPNLDRLAQQGMRFTSAYCAQPICSPSRAAILTGKTPARLHLTTFLPGRPNAPSQKLLHPEIEMQVPLHEKMICNYLKEAGYATAAIGKWHVGGDKFGPLEHGFDVYHPGKANTRPSATEGGKGEYDLTAAAEKFIEQHQDRPFFVYLAHNTPHIPYDAQRSRIEHNAQAFEPVYAGVIETLDDTVGRLLAKLDALKLADKTIVVFTSDNGGLHVPEGPHPKITHNTPYRAGKGFVYEGGLRIPLIVRWPGHVAAGKTVDDPVINTDWIPTLLDLIGQPVPAGLDGISMAALLTGRGPAPQRKFFWHFPHYTNQGSRPSGGMRDGNWMMVEYYDDAKTELYDLGKDIRESRDLGDAQPQRVNEMRAALAAWRKEANAQENAPNPDFDPAKYRPLYVDVDASRFDPAAADHAQWQTMWQWRKAMNAAVAGAERPAGLRLAAGGVPCLPIVISAKASPRCREIADELARYLGRITGGKFEIRTGDGSQGIVVGTLAEFPNPELAEGLRIRRGFDGKEAYSIRTEAKRLLLIGATELGVSHAAFRLLEQLGCRWFFPAKEWEVVPLRPTLAIQMNVNERPALLARRIWWGYGFFDQQRCRDDYQAWARHNRMASSLEIACGHAWQSIIAARQKTFDQHPEYLALVNGKRQGPQLCVSNSDVRKLVAEYALEQFQRQPQRDMVSLETSDGDGHCQCDACRRLGSISDRVFGLANEVARVVAEKCPGKMVGLYAYNDHCEPPSFPLEPNVYVQSTAGFIRGKYTFRELMELWPKRCQNMGFYDYFSVWLWDFDMPPGGRGANLAYIRQQIPHYVACHATSVDCESGNNWGIHGLGYYVANRLMWDPATDADALMSDFLEKAFGPAAPAMRRYYERLDPAKDPLLSRDLLARALRDLAEASKLAAVRPDVLARLDHLKQYQHYVRLRWQYERTADKDQKRDVALAALTHVYRTRYSYMNHWEAIRQQWTPTLAKEFDRPNWSFRDPSPDKPWKVEAPCSHEETERLFEDDLNYFQPQPVDEKSFSRNLVSGGFHSDKPAATSQRFQGKARYALFHQGGEALELTITTGLIAWYRDRPDASYAISDAAGKEIAGGRLPQDGQEHHLAIKLPQAGLYWFDFDDQAAGWGITAAPGQKVSLAPERGARLSHMGHMQPMYFFVPKGVKEIQYFWDGYPHEVHGPDGKRVAEVTSRGEYIRVTVPAGGDAKIWSFTKFCPGRLWFFNLPNYLAASPDALLVPEEVK